MKLKKYLKISFALFVGLISISPVSKNQKTLAASTALTATIPYSNAISAQNYSTTLSGLNDQDDNPISLTYMLGAYTSRNGMVGGNKPDGYASVGTNYGTFGGTKLDLDSANIDKPNLNINAQGNLYGSLYGDVDKTSFGTQLISTSGLMVNSSDLKTNSGTVSGNIFFNPAYTSVNTSKGGISTSKDANGNTNKIIAHYTSFYPGATKDSKNMLEIDNDLTMTYMPDGSMYVQQSSTNMTSDLSNVYLGRRYDTDISTGYQRPGLIGDTLPIKYIGHNSGLYMDGTDGGSGSYPVRLNYQFNVPDGPDSWIGTKSTNNSIITGWLSDFIDSSRFTSLTDLGNNHPNDYDDSKYGEGQIAVASKSDTGIQAKWTVGNWNKGQTINTSYVVGLTTSSAPILDLNNKNQKNDGQNITLSGGVIDADANNTAEKIYYQVDTDGTPKELETGSQLTTVPSGSRKEFTGTVSASEVDNSKAHTIIVWAEDANGQKSNSQQFLVEENPDYVPPTSTTMVNPDHMYWSQQYGSGNRNLTSGNWFTMNQLGGWDIANDKNDNYSFSLKSENAFQSLNNRWGNMYATVSNDNSDGKDKDDLSIYSDYGQQVFKQASGDSNAEYGFVDGGSTGGNINNNNGKGGPISGDFPSGNFLSANWGYVNTSFLNTLDPQVKHYFKLGQDLISSNNEIDGIDYTTDSIPFIIIAPPVTVDATKTVVNDNANNIINSTIQGTSDQNGDQVFAIADANNNGEFDSQDEANAKVVQNARENGDSTDSALALTKTDNSTVDSNGNYALNFKDSAWDNNQLKKGNTVWVVEFNGSGGTSGVSNPSGDGNSLNGNKVTNATPVTVSSSPFSIGTKSTNWYFGKNDHKAGDYELKQATDDNGNLQPNQLDINSSLKSWSVNAQLGKFTDVNDSSRQLNNVQIKLNNTQLVNDSNNNYKSDPKNFILDAGGSAVNLFSVADADTNTSGSGLHLLLGGPTKDSSSYDNTKLSVSDNSFPADANNGNEYNDYQATMNWTLVNSIS